jgi:hypothetical protein
MTVLIFLKVVTALAARWLGMPRNLLRDVSKITANNAALAEVFPAVVAGSLCFGMLHIVQYHSARMRPLSTFFMVICISLAGGTALHRTNDSRVPTIAASMLIPFVAGLLSMHALLSSQETRWRVMAGLTACTKDLEAVSASPSAPLCDEPHEGDPLLVFPDQHALSSSDTNVFGVARFRDTNEESGLLLAFPGRHAPGAEPLSPQLCLGKRLGSGGSANVYLAIWAGSRVAAKVLHCRLTAATRTSCIPTFEACLLPCVPCSVRELFVCLADKWKRGAPSVS